VFIFRKKILVDLFLQEEGPETLGDFSTPQEEDQQLPSKNFKFGCSFSSFHVQKNLNSSLDLSSTKLEFESKFELGFYNNGIIN
jgi:hypothetical protein